MIRDAEFGVELFDLVSGGGGCNDNGGRETSGRARCAQGRGLQGSRELAGRLYERRLEAGGNRSRSTETVGEDRDDKILRSEAWRVNLPERIDDEGTC